MLHEIVSQYNLCEKDLVISSFGTGLINSTWKVSSERMVNQFLLQRVNNAVFKRPEHIAYNIRIVAEYLKQNYPDYLFISPLRSATNDELVIDRHGGFFRLFPFIENSHTVDVVSFSAEAYEAARAFAQFTKLLSGFNSSLLKVTLEDFHNLSLRYQQFKEAVRTGNPRRKSHATDLIRFLEDHYDIVHTYETLRSSGELKVRVTHHDTKISNVLFDDSNKALCVIDLDTVMPGYFISDVGDMMRTYLSPVSEEEADTSKIMVRDEYFEAIAKGYLSTMRDELTSTEIAHFVYAGKFMIYMQALRFLTDYLNDDQYYGARYESQNLIRSKNQISLLRSLISKEPRYQDIVAALISVD